MYEDSNQDLKIFGLSASKEFATSVSLQFKLITDNLKFKLSPHSERDFDDSEPYLRASENVRGCDVYIIQSLYGDQTCENNVIFGETASSKLIKLLFFAGSMRDASAGRITVVMPYHAFSRQDRKINSREPIYTKYTAMLLESVGVDRVLTMDVHNLSAFQNAYRIQTDNLEAKNLISDWFAANVPMSEELVVVSPDSGGMGRAKRFRDVLSKKIEKDIGLAYLDKTRRNGNAEGENIIGDVQGKLSLIVDDMISSGKTVMVCQRAIEKAGGELWAAACTHGLFVGKANDYLAGVKRVITTDTVAPFRLDDSIKKKLTVISTAKLFAQAIRRTHVGDSISALIE